jgi:hypothetical protein
MMFLFVAMLHLPGAIRVGGRIPWTVVIREMSFGGGGWILAGIAMSRKGDGQCKSLITVGRVLIAIAAIVFGAQHFLHPLGLPGVPLQKQMPTWVPARAFIDYLRGAFLTVWWGLLSAGSENALGGRVSRRLDCAPGCGHLRTCSDWALADPNSGVQIKGLNYFADTLLFGAVTLSLARATTTRKSEGAAADDCESRRRPWKSQLPVLPAIRP